MKKLFVALLGLIMLYAWVIGNAALQERYSSLQQKIGLFFPPYTMYIGVVEFFAPPTLWDMITVLNRQLPMEIDDQTQLTKITTTDDELSYHYSLAVKKEDVNMSIIDGIVDDMEIAYCLDPLFEPLRQNNISIICKFKDVNGEHIIIIAKNSYDCP